MLALLSGCVWFKCLIETKFIWIERDLPPYKQNTYIMKKRTFMQMGFFALAHMSKTIYEELWEKEQKKGEKLSNYTLIIIERFAAEPKKPSHALPMRDILFALSQLFSVALYLNYSREKCTSAHQIFFSLRNFKDPKKKNINDKAISKINDKPQAHFSIFFSHQ